MHSFFKPDNLIPLLNYTHANASRKSCVTAMSSILWEAVSGVSELASSSVILESSTRTPMTVDRRRKGGKGGNIQGGRNVMN